jgi:uncharacterized protein YcaQ
MMTITPTTARRLAIHAQRLSGTAGDMLDTIRQIGCLQLDPTSIVARNHLLVLWSRLGNYDLAAFERLMWQERQLFEYWAHAASIVLTEHYPIHALQMQRSYNGSTSWTERMQHWVKQNQALHDHVLHELKTRGPLKLSDIGGKDKVGMEWISGGWTTERSAARMVDYLWLRGTVLVHSRQGQNRLWHLAEQVLPPWTPRQQEAEREVTKRAVQISLRALGTGTMQHIRNHFVRASYPDLADIMKELLHDGVIQRVRVADSETAWKGDWFIHREDLPLLADLEAGKWQPRTTLLSPFDNLICDRKRTELMWDFYFRLEIYTPKQKRQYGYFVMPILHGDRLIGRIDPQFERKGKRLLVHAYHVEPSVKLGREEKRAIQTAIDGMGSWLGAKEVVMPQAT